MITNLLCKHIYIASCTRNGGIYHYILKPDGKFVFIDKICEDRPMYLASEGGRLFAVLKMPFKNSNLSGITSYRINDDGSLSDRQEIISSQGIEGCHILADGGNIYCANYTSGDIIKIPGKQVKHHGSSINKERQSSAHPHFISLSPDGRNIYVADLGLDKIMIYDKNLNYLSSVSVPEGSGARHLAFSEDNQVVYCANELTSTVSVFEMKDGLPVLVCTESALPPEFKGESTAAAIRCRGKYVYISNRGHDSISCLKYENKKLTLEYIKPCGGKSPRDFNIVGDYVICTNENSGNVTVFKFNGYKMEQTGTELYIENPLCVISI